MPAMLSGQHRFAGKPPTSCRCRVDDVVFIHHHGAVGGWVKRHPPYDSCPRR